MLWRSGRSTRPSADSRTFWRAGARMARLIYLPASKGARKQGVDDYLASGHTVDELLEYATPDLKSPPHDEEPEHPYQTSEATGRPHLGQADSERERAHAAHELHGEDHRRRLRRR